MNDRFSFAGTAAAIADHFPGAPIVPGALILREVIRAANNPHINGIQNVKFFAPLRPDECCSIEWLRLAGAKAEFRCRVGTRLIASGWVTFAEHSV